MGDHPRAFNDLNASLMIVALAQAALGAVREQQLEPGGRAAAMMLKTKRCYGCNIRPLASSSSNALASHSRFFSC